MLREKFHSEFCQILRRPGQTVSADGADKVWSNSGAPSLEFSPFWNDPANHPSQVSTLA